MHVRVQQKRATATAATARMEGAYVSFMLMLDGSLGIDKNESRDRCVCM